MKRALIDWFFATLISIVAVAAAFWTGYANAHTIGANLVTSHSTPGYRVWTPGLYARSDSGLTVGILRNSERSWGAHAGKTWHTQVMGLPIDLQAGAITGYRRAPVLPMAAASVLLGEHHRIIAIPGPSCLAVHYALEWK